MSESILYSTYLLEELLPVLYSKHAEAEYAIGYECILIRDFLNYSVAAYTLIR